MVVDEAFWPQFSGTSFVVPLIKGPYHNYPCGPYRLHAFGLRELYRRHPDADWYFHLEYDTLVLNPGFKKDLRAALKSNVWVMGIDHRVYPMNFPLLEDITGMRFTNAHYLIGCCQFYRREAVSKIDFDTILNTTDKFKMGYFPGYDRFSFDEELLPTVVAGLGGEVKGLGKWDESTCKWDGSLYRVRYRPMIHRNDLSVDTSIIHPVKDDNDIRTYHRAARLKFSQRRERRL